MIKVLFVDDSTDNLNLYRIYLKKEKDIECVFIDSGAQAIEALKNIKYDVAFIDVQMPDVNGFDVVTFIDEHKLEVIPIALTGFNDAETLDKISTYSFKEVLIKPILKNDLISKINEYR